MTIGAITSSLQGIQSNQSRFQDAAHRISQFGTTTSEDSEPGVSLENSMVDILTARRGIQANLQVFKVADEMLGTLIDTLA